MRCESRKVEVLIKRLAGNYVQSREIRLKISSIKITQIRRKIRQKSNAAQFFSVCLLLLLVSCFFFCLGGSAGLTVDLAIDGMMSIVGKIADNLYE